LSGKKYREIAETLGGVSLERARQRVAAGRRTAGQGDRHKNAKIIGDLMVSVQLKSGLKSYGADSMTFDEFIDTTTPRWYKEVYGIGKAFSEELLAVLREKGVPEHKIKAWKKRKGRVFKT
tara:strand:+ start:100 stop:462 length:363 start_codon:yes stop_codon:yes gene_type:complete